MTRQERFSAEEIKEIIRLAEEEGLKDVEIAEIMKCHRVTISRLRSRHHIPRPNYQNRKDKIQVCKRCGAETLIRRKIRSKKYCKSCQTLRWEERKEEKRVYMRARQK